MIESQSKEGEEVELTFRGQQGEQMRSLAGWEGMAMATEPGTENGLCLL